MSFDPLAQKIPAKPDRLQLVLTVTQTGPITRKYEGSYRFEIKSVVDAEGNGGELLESRQGDAIPYYTVAERTQFAALLDKGFNLARGVVP